MKGKIGAHLVFLFGKRYWKEKVWVTTVITKDSKNDRGMSSWNTKCMNLCDNVLYNVEVLWYSGVTARLSRWEPGFDSRCRPVLLSFSKTLYPHCCSRPRCINGDPVGCERYCGWVGMCAPKMATGRNAPQGVEKVHCECRIDSESYDRGNNTLWSALILIGKALYKNQLLLLLLL